MAKAPETLGGNRGQPFGHPLINSRPMQNAPLPVLRGSGLCSLPFHPYVHSTNMIATITDQGHFFVKTPLHRYVGKSYHQVMVMHIASAHNRLDQRSWLLLALNPDRILRAQGITPDP